MPKTIALLTALLILAPPVTPWTGDDTRVQVLPALPDDVRVLHFDPRGRGRLVAALGDPLHAKHIAVVVPGSDVDVPRFGAVLAMARAVHQEAGRPDDLAVVAWLGYDTPEGVGVDAATGRLARAGAEALTAFVRDLPPTALVHLLCHSYGSVVCALAAHDLDVADIVFTGSPGVRAGSVAELGTGARVWAARAGRDWTRWVPKVRLGDLGHGTDPTGAGFGARVFDAGDGKHDEYYRAGGDSLRTIARIVVGDAR
ncbi:alpha/beta hydrolase [Umezawaea tangerina]|uniref:Alpha/beta hydrolase family protein n=1 Tax=Umezawaea tangerina TaxID=84725 RepID=A0A2T0TE71_9PSEU|nr:alpha/beta hydrolase [Umezawaea tangerina]PRY43960.1 alpha/beta hydrolase family protein [Umezawaea tangerina]